MKKLCVFMIFMVLVTFSGCETKTSAETEKAPGNADEEVTVVIPGEEDTEEDYSSEKVSAESEETDTGYTSEKAVSSETNHTPSTCYYANKNTKKFHYNTCSSAKLIKTDNLYITDSREELINSGFVPCKNCNP